MSWRLCLRDFLSYNPELTDVYEFGVFTGSSMVTLLDIYKDCGIPIRNIYGLDSFEGLPEEKEEPKWQECWGKGDFNSQSHFSVNSVKESMKKIEELLEPNLGKTKLSLIPGFFEKTLNKNTVSKYNMDKASYVDCDVDIYSSTVEMLDFVMEHQIMVPGTLIGFDDIGGVPFPDDFTKAGEARAWKECRNKYDISAVKLVTIGGSYPHTQELWKVLDIQ